MPGASLFALLDDVASVLDDIAVLTKVAAKKTAGVLGDDLALNAQQVTGVASNRELPVVWAVAKGSMVNKAILVPAALAISAVMSWAVTPLLMLGGLYLCYEGVEKLFHKLFPSQDDRDHRDAIRSVVVDPDVDMLDFEREKIKGAIATDFVLSAEIIVIALGTVSDKVLASQFAVLASVAILMTIGVYGFVAGIVKLDDIGLLLVANPKASLARRVLGRALLRGAPLLMKALSVLGTLAMFLVGGGILVHGIPPLAHTIESISRWMAPLANGLVGVLGGVVVLLGIRGFGRIWKQWRRRRT